MRVFDASSIVYAWDNYPVDQFPRLWLWLGDEVNAGHILMCQVCFEEVEHVSPDCARWLSSQHMTPLEISNEIAAQALAIKGALGIQNDHYHPNGVDENDIIAIAAARILAAELVTDEARQPNLPLDLRRYKIPAVCGLPSVQVVSRNFLEFIKATNQVFG